MGHEVVRTQRPVGQGCFFTEEHDLGGGSGFHLVYDCGSTSAAKTALPERVNEFASRPLSSNGILVVSHFHADHVNGLHLLKGAKIKFCRTFIPGLTPDQARVVFFDAAVRLGKAATGAAAADALRTAWQLLIDGGEGWEGLVRVIPDEASAVPEPVRLPPGGGDHPHSKSLYPDASLAALDWRIRFYCHVQAGKLADLTKKFGADFDAAFAGGFESFVDWLRDKKRSGSVVQRYRKAMGVGDGDDKWDNLVSLCCYTGPGGGRKYGSYIESAVIPAGALLAAGSWGRHLSRRDVGWLGTGDIPFGNARRGGAKVWVGFKSHYAGELPSVVLATVPHHGSPEDHQAAFYHRMMAATVSYGADVGPRKYGHPDPGVIADIVRRGAVLALVTEDPNSAFVARFFSR